MGCMAVGRNSRERWPSGRMQGGTRRNDSYTEHSLPFLWHERSPRVTGYFPQYNKPRMDTNKKQDLASAIGIMRRARDVNSYPQAQPDGNREREAENVDQDAAARGVKWEKQTGCPRGTAEYAHGIVQVSTDEALSCRRWSTTLMWYVYKKQGHAQIDH